MQGKLDGHTSGKTWRYALYFAIILAGLFPLPAHGQAVLAGPWDVYVPLQIPDGRVNALWLDKEEQELWVGTDNGLGCYDGHKWQPYELEAGLPAEVRAVSGDGVGGVWVGTNNGLGHFDGTNWQRLTTSGSGLPDNWINALSLDGKGGLWIGTMRGFAYLTGDPGHYEVDPQLRFTELDDEPLGAVHAILPTQPGGAFFAVGNEIIYLSPEGATQRYGKANGLYGGRVQDLVGDGEDELWAGTESGLYRWRGETFELASLADEAAGEEPDILSLAGDGASGLWLGTKEGLWHFDGERVDERIQAAAGQLAANRVLAIERMSDGTLWLGTSGGLNRWNPDAWRDLSMGTAFRPLAAQGDRIWAISDQELVVWENDGWVPVSATSSPWPDGDATWFSNIFANVEAELYQQQVMRMAASVYNVSGDYRPNVLDGAICGDLWLGTDEGVLHFTRGKLDGHYDISDGLPGDLVRALLVQKGTVWVGTFQGLAWWDGQAWNQADWGGLGEAEIVRAIVQGKDACESLWVGTADGLWRLPQGKKPDVRDNWQRYTSEDGLVSSKVNALWANPNGQLWVGTTGGLSGLDDNGTCDDKDKKADDVWVTLKAADGLVNNQVTAVWRDSQGALWVATGTGGKTALVRHVPTTLAPSLSVAQESKLNWWSLDLVLEFNGASLVTDHLFYRYQFPGDNWRRGQPKPASWRPSDGDSFAVHVFDADLNSAILNDVELDIPWWQRPWGYWWVRLGVYSVIALAILALTGRELRRWWRGRRRAGYRETWEVAFNQVRPDLPVCTIHAQRHFKRDIRLLAEGRSRHFLDPAGETIVTSSELPDNIRVLHDNWRSAVVPNAPEHLDALSRSLAAVLLPDAVIRQLQEVTNREGYRVRLRLDFTQAPGLAAYPWEVAQPHGLETLGLNPDTAVSRQLQYADEPDANLEATEPGDQTPALAPLQRDRKPKILLIVASPRMPPAYEDLPRLEVAKELERLEEALDGAQVTLDILGGVRTGGEETELDMGEALSAKLMSEENAPDIVHFIGHAGPHPRKPKEIVLYFEDYRGHFRPLGAERLVEMIRNSQNLLNRPKLLVLNACQTAAVNGGETLAGLVPALITQTGLMAVVGMQYPIGDEAAAVFTSTFYRELLQTQPIDYVVSRARQAIKDELGGRDWAAPVLYMQVADGMIYEP